ncbi:MAG TPA: glutamate 5-kinase [Pyrinomonadaceae bacterium]|nr:glutamate 5-kinase [Pyrinomonadaceae bacterium]
MTQQNLETERRKRLSTAQRVVIKLGTSTVTGEGGKVSTERIEPLARSIVALKKAGRQIVLVSSGAVGLGAGRLGLHPSRLKDVVIRQACAAVGQSLLMHAYEKLFHLHEVNIAQVLLTEDDFTDFRRYTNLRRTMEKLLKLGVLPIINENDTVSTAELESELEYDQTESGHERVFGDNDRLAALVMSKLEADALILLTNVDGLLNHQAKPRGDDQTDVPGQPLSLVEEITDDLKAIARGPSAGGRGGMLTKLEAAQIAMQAGGVCVIANGKTPEVLDRVLAGEQMGTTFMPRSRMAGKRRWITYAAGVRGRVIVNEGAREAIIKGKGSLLASGVVRIEQQFAPQDVVSIADADGREFARGIISCASDEAARLIEGTAPHQLGERGRVLVTRDNLVLSEQR